MCSFQSEADCEGAGLYMAAGEGRLGSPALASERSDRRNGASRRSELLTLWQSWAHSTQIVWCLASLRSTSTSMVSMSASVHRARRRPMRHPCLCAGMLPVRCCSEQLTLSSLTYTSDQDRVLGKFIVSIRCWISCLT